MSAMMAKRRRASAFILPSGRSSVSMPTGDYTDATTGTTWTAIWEDDFDIDYASVDQPYSSGVGWDPGAVNTANDGRLPVGNPYRSKFTSYPSTVTDTSAVGQYYARKTMSTSGSCLQINMHRAVISERTNSTADPGGTVYPDMPLGATFKPDLTPAGLGYLVTYARFQTAMRVTPTAGRYGGVWQQINDNFWPIYGEHDFPEGQYIPIQDQATWSSSNKEGPIHGYFHPAQASNENIGYWPNGRNTPWDSGSYAENYWYQNWHVFTQQWEPSGGGARLRWWLDNILVLDRTDRVGTNPLVGCMFQCGTNGSSLPLIDTTCLVEIDWVKMWKHPQTV